MLPRSTRWGLLLVVVAALMTFAVALHGSFVAWDDRWLVVANPHLRGFHHLFAILDPTGFRMTLGAEYLPVRDVSNLVDFTFFELEPRGYRLGNLLLYALSAGLAYAVLLEFLESRRAALVGALLWAVHPIHAEVVAWASARKDLLNAVLSLLATCLVLRAFRTGRRWMWLAALGAFVLATLSKTTAAALPVVLAIWLVLRGSASIPLPRRIGRAALHVAPLFLVAAAGAWGNQVHQRAGWVEQEWQGGGWLPNAMIMCGVHLRYVAQMVFPFNMTTVYAADAMHPDKPWNLAGLLFLVFTLVIPFVIARRFPRASAGVFWWLVLLLPVANLVVPIGNVSADRYLFLPSLGFCALVGLAADRLSTGVARRTRIVEGCVCAVAVAFSVLGARQAMVWRDSLALWRHAVKVSPDSGRAWQNLAEAYFVLDRREEGIDALRRMVEAEPWDAVFWMQYGNRLWAMGGPEHEDEVEEILRTAVRKCRPDRGGPLVALAWLVNQKNTPEAKREAVDLLQEALERQPTLSEAHYNLGLWHHVGGRTARAIEHFTEALRLRMAPQDEIRIHERLARIHAERGDEEAARHHREERERLRAFVRGE